MNLGREAQDSESLLMLISRTALVILVYIFQSHMSIHSTMSFAFGITFVYFYKYIHLFLFNISIHIGNFTFKQKRPVIPNRYNGSLIFESKSHYSAGVSVAGSSAFSSAGVSSTGASSAAGSLSMVTSTTGSSSSSSSSRKS